MRLLTARSREFLCALKAEEAALLSSTGCAAARRETYRNLNFLTNSGEAEVLGPAFSLLWIFECAQCLHLKTSAKFEVQISCRWLCFPRAELTEGLAGGTHAGPLVSSSVASVRWEAGAVMYQLPSGEVGLSEYFSQPAASVNAQWACSAHLQKPLL